MGDVIIGTAFGDANSVSQRGQSSKAAPKINPYLKADATTSYELSLMSLSSFLNRSVNEVGFAGDIRVGEEDCIKIYTPLYLGVAYSGAQWSALKDAYRELIGEDQPTRLKIIEKMDRVDASMVSDLSAHRAARILLKREFSQINVFSTKVTFEGSVFPAILCAAKETGHGTRHIFQEYMDSKKPDRHFYI